MNEIKTGCSGKVYENAGNPAVVELIPCSAQRVLDVGCGAGANARLVHETHPGTVVSGLTISPAEASAASHYLEQCWIGNIEAESDPIPSDERFDCLLLSHVLEHLADPAAALRRLVAHLEPDGVAVIAVPNLLQWRQRSLLVRGHFDYEEAGVLDRTHLRFFSFESAPRELVDPVPELELVAQTAEGSVPLWLLRRHVLPMAWSKAVDEWAVRHWPGLFAGQILMVARKRSNAG